MSEEKKKETVAKEARFEFGYWKMRALRTQSEINFKAERVKTLELEIALAQEKISRVSKEMGELKALKVVEDAHVAQLQGTLQKEYSINPEDVFEIESGEIKRAPKPETN